MYMYPGSVVGLQYYNTKCAMWRRILRTHQICNSRLEFILVSAVLTRCYIPVNQALV